MKGHEQSSGPSPTTGPEEAGSGAKGDKWRQFAIGVLPPWIVAPCRLLRECFVHRVADVRQID
jgi:hypothetical protein